jgi:hypothetical protein
LHHTIVEACAVVQTALQRTKRRRAVLVEEARAPLGGGRAQRPTERLRPRCRWNTELYEGRAVDEIVFWKISISIWALIAVNDELCP